MSHKLYTNESRTIYKWITNYTQMSHGPVLAQCNTLQHTAKHCSTLQHTATHCNTRQHTATHCNTHLWLVYCKITVRAIYRHINASRTHVRTESRALFRRLSHELIRTHLSHSKTYKCITNSYAHKIDTAFQNTLSRTHMHTLVTHIHIWMRHELTCTHLSHS